MKRLARETRRSLNGWQMIKFLPVWIGLIRLACWVIPDNAQERAESGRSLPNRSFPPPTVTDSAATKRVKNGPPAVDPAKMAARRAQDLALEEENRRKAVEEAAQLVK